MADKNKEVEEAKKEAAKKVEEAKKDAAKPAGKEAVKKV